MAKKQSALSVTKMKTPLELHPSYFKSIIENSHDAILGKRLDGTIVSWNKAAEKLYGYTSEEIIGKSAYTLVPPERHAEEKHILERISKGKQVALRETYRLTKEGKYLQVSVTISPILDDDGTIIGASTLARDISIQRTIIRQQEFMIHASTVLSSSLNYNKTLKSVANLAVDYIADWCAIDLMTDKREVELVAVAHKDKKKAEWAYEVRNMYPINFDEPTGTGRVLLSGKAELYPFISDEMIKQTVKTEQEFMKVILIAQNPRKNLDESSVESTGTLKVGDYIGSYHGRRREYFRRVANMPADEMIRRQTVIAEKRRLTQGIEQTKSFYRNNWKDKDSSAWFAAQQPETDTINGIYASTPEEQEVQKYLARKRR